MEIKTENNGLIMAFAEIGGIEDGKEINTVLHEGFADEFEPGKYKLSNDQVILNPDYESPSYTEPSLTATAEQISLTSIAKQMADQQQHIASLEQALTALSQGGANS